MFKFPNKKIISTGVSDQLDCIGFYRNNVEIVTHYLQKCINSLFPNQIILRVNKRLEKEEDRIQDKNTLEIL